MMQKRFAQNDCGLNSDDIELNSDDFMMGEDHPGKNEMSPTSWPEKWISGARIAKKFLISVIILAFLFLPSIVNGVVIPVTKQSKEGISQFSINFGPENLPANFVSISMHEIELPDCKSICDEPKKFCEFYKEITDSKSDNGESVSEDEKNLTENEKGYVTLLKKIFRLRKENNNLYLTQAKEWQKRKLPLLRLAEEIFSKVEVVNFFRAPIKTAITVAAKNIGVHVIKDIMEQYQHKHCIDYKNCCFTKTSKVLTPFIGFYVFESTRFLEDRSQEHIGVVRRNYQSNRAIIEKIIADGHLYLVTIVAGENVQKCLVISK